MDNKTQVENFSRAVKQIKEEIKKDLVGQEDIVNNVIIAIIAGGNVLLEGVPGVGKTRLVRLPISCWRTRSTAQRPKRSPPCSKLCRSTR